jgi:hypothetical protein
MKILKIENGCGHFRKEPDGTWSPIDTIDKNDLLKLLNLFLDAEVEMDDPSECELHNEVHKIVYSNIFEKLESLSENKSAFKDDSERKYLSELNKYSSA